jgi:hypothetical protein
VWNAAFHGNWPDEKETIQWILDEYLDLETAKACGYLELVVPLRQQAEAALNAAKSKAADQHRQVKIDADIDEVIETIRGLGGESDQKSGAAENCGEKPNRKRDRCIRSAATTMIAVAVAALAGFVGGYNSRAAKHPADIAVAPSPEIRRAILVEPEIRRAIPVEPEIRKAIPVQTWETQVDRRSNAVPTEGTAIPRDGKNSNAILISSATYHGTMKAKQTNRKETMNPDGDIQQEIREQMDKDFEDYKKRLAEGTYPEAQQVEEDVRQWKERNADAPEEVHRKLAVSAIAARKRLHKLFREMEEDFEDYKKKIAEGTYPHQKRLEEEVKQMREVYPNVSEEGLLKAAVSDIAAEKRRDKLFAGNLECGESVPPIVTPEDNEADEEVIAQKVRDIEQHEKAITEREKQFEEMERLVESIRRLRAERKKKEQQ